MKGTSRAGRGAMDHKWTQFTESKETKWITTLRTACPSGHNDKN